MFRVLPVTIMFLAAFVAFKAYTKASENNILHDGFPKNSEQVNVESVDALQAIEPAAGEAETKLPEEEAPAVEEKPAAEEQGDAKEKPLPDYISTERPEETGIGYYCETPNKCKLMVDKLPANERLLLQMSKRRVELEDWKKDLDMRASLIEASSRKLDNKIAQLEELKKSTQALLDEYKGEDDKQIQSMVKIYENMKPKEAAQVFNQLQMPILLEIVQKMNERRVSPILAKMDSKRAKELTEKIIENRGLAKM